MSQPQVVFGAGYAHIEQVKDARGNKITPPQVIAAPAVQNISADFGKADVKTLFGQKEFAIHAAQGKKSTEVSFECGELYVEMLNALYFGQSVVAGATLTRRDAYGTQLLPAYKSVAKIQNVKTVNLGRWVADTGVTIKQGSSHVAATKITDVNGGLTSGQYKCFGGRYYFAEADRGKEIKISYVVMDKTTQGGVTGTSVVSTLKIPSDLRYNSHLFAFAGKISNSTLIRDASSLSTVVDVGHYVFMDNGVLILHNTVATGALAAKPITHTTDGVNVSTVIAELPAAGYVAIINPPASAAFVADAGVALTLGTIAGLAVGDSLAQAATPITGQYDVDAGGIYTFAAADAGTTVTISYLTDFLFISSTPPSGGTFLADKGVRDSDGVQFTRVDLTTPISLLPKQYAVSGNGTYYFDNAHFNERLYIDFDYQSDAGVTLNMENNDMGSTPIVAITLSGEAEGKQWRIHYPKAIPKSFGFATKMDDFGTYKVTYEVIADRVSNLVGTVSMGG